MSEVTVEELLEIARVAVGDDDEIVLDESIFDVPFDQLNLDSLHIMAINTKLELEHRFKFPEDRDYGRVTPRELVALANERIVG